MKNYNKRNAFYGVKNLSVLPMIRQLWKGFFTSLRMTGYLILLILSISSYAFSQTTDNLTALTLQQAVELGLENQPSLKAMESQRKTAEYEVGIAKTNFYPKLSANTFLAKANEEMLMNSLSTPDYITHIEPNNSIVQNFTLMVPLFTGGKNIGMYNKSKNEKNSVENDYQSARLDLILQIKTIYRMAIYFRELVNTYHELLKESEERVKNDREAYETGKIAYTNVLRNETRLAQSRQMVTNTEKDYQTAIVQLRALMGMDSNSPITLSQDTITPEKIELTQDDSLDIALKNRPDILVIMNKLKAAKSDITVSQSSLYPQVGFTAMNDFMKMDGVDNTEGWSVGLVASFPFFGSGQSFYQIKQAKENHKQAEYNYQAEILKTKADVESAWLAIHAAEQNITTTQKGVEQAEEDFRIMKMAYESGKRINVEYLDALTALYQAKTDYSKAVLDYNLSVDQLYRVIGKDKFNQ